MSSRATKTNNDPIYKAAKIKLRLQSLPNKQEIKILDAFCGEGILWQEVQKQTNKKLIITGIDKTKYNNIHLIGDNIKFITNFDLTKYDIIDLDAYGSPYKLLKILFKKNYKGIVHCTFIQTMFGRIDSDLLLKLNYTSAMLKKCQTLLCKNPMAKLTGYLHQNKINKITGIFTHNKNYFYFQTSI